MTEKRIAAQTVLRSEGAGAVFGGDFCINRRIDIFSQGSWVDACEESLQLFGKQLLILLAADFLEMLKQPLILFLGERRRCEFYRL